MLTVLGFLAFVVAAIVALPLGGLIDNGLASLFPSLIPLLIMLPWTGTAILFLVLFVILSGITAALASATILSGGGLWSASPVRYIIGRIAFMLLFLPSLAIVLTITGALFDRGWWWLLDLLTHPRRLWHPFDREDGRGLLAQLLDYVVLGGGYAAALGLVDVGKWIVARVSLPFRRVWQALKMGVGGSASFQGLLDEWMEPWKPGQIILGTSLYEPQQRLGRFDDRHLLTVASTRSGKGRSSIIPNLLTWPGSVLVIDPKGQNAAVTVNTRREKLGQDIHIVDPFGQLAALGRYGLAYPVQRFNPLDAVDLDAADVVEQIGNIADALIIRSDHGNPFWDNAAKSVLEGIIAHVLCSAKVKPEDKHLGTVRDYVAGVNGRAQKDMIDTPSPGNLAAIACMELARASEGAGGDILTTLAVHVKWLDSPAMRHTLSASDFELNTLKNRNASLYLVIPSQYLEQHARFMRLFITLAMRAAGRGVKGRHPMLFVLDEFATLGPLKVVEQAAGLLAGGGVRIWPIIQNLTQLRMYGDNWEVFLANAGQIQVFAVNDQSTARYFSERLGHHMSWRRVGSEYVPGGATFFRTSAELSRSSSRDSGRSIVFYEGGEQALMRRAPYDKIFAREDYTADPYEAGQPKSWRQIAEDPVDAFFAWADRTPWASNLVERFEAWLDAKQPGKADAPSRPASPQPPEDTPPPAPPPRGAALTVVPRDPPQPAPRPALVPVADMPTEDGGFGFAWPDGEAALEAARAAELDDEQPLHNGRGISLGRSGRSKRKPPVNPPDEPDSWETP